MAQISDATLATIRTEITNLRAKAANAMQRARGHSASKSEELKAVGEATLAAGAIGYMRGKYQKADGAWEFMGVDIELALGLALVALPLSGLKTGLPNKDLSNAGLGIMSHFVGQMARGYATSGKFRLIAGNAPQMIAGQSSGQSYFTLPHPQDVGNWENDVDDSSIGSLSGASTF